MRFWLALSPLLRCAFGGGSSACRRSTMPFWSALATTMSPSWSGCGPVEHEGGRLLGHLLVHVFQAVHRLFQTSASATWWHWPGRTPLQRTTTGPSPATRTRRRCPATANDCPAAPTRSSVLRDCRRRRAAGETRRRWTRNDAGATPRGADTLSPVGKVTVSPMSPLPCKRRNSPSASCPICSNRLHSSSSTS